jgi:hypothetical protein
MPKTVRDEVEGILVRFQDGTDCTVPAHASDTVAQLKQRIQEHSGRAVCALYADDDEESLDDAGTLSACGVSLSSSGPSVLLATEKTDADVVLFDMFGAACSSVQLEELTTAKGHSIVR